MWWEMSDKSINDVEYLPQWTNLKQFTMASCSVKIPGMELASLIPTSIESLEIIESSLSYLSLQSIIAFIRNLPRLKYLKEVYIVNDEGERSEELDVPYVTSEIV